MLTFLNFLINACLIVFMLSTPVAIFMAIELRNKEIFKTRSFRIASAALVLCLMTDFVYGMVWSPARENAEKKQAVDEQAAEKKTADDQERADNEEKQKEALKYWKNSAGALGQAFSTLGHTAALAGNDPVMVFSVVKQAGETADEARQQSFKPGMPQEVKESLMVAADNLKEACQSLMDYMDDKKLSQKANAMDKSRLSRAAAWDAIHKARAYYVLIGGKAEMIGDFGIEDPGQ